MSYNRYLEVVSKNFKKAIKIEWLNPNETVNFEFTNALYDMSIDLSVNYQNGSRRSCTITLNNDKNKFPINFNNIWIGQKFKLWLGVYIDEKTPYYLPQGVFYISNPEEVFQPNQRVIKINGVDKWAFLDGTLYGKLSGTYQTAINTNLFDATRHLLRLPRIPLKSVNNNIEDYFYITNNDKNYYFELENGTFTSNDQVKKNFLIQTILTAKSDMVLNFQYSYTISSGTNGSGCYFTLIVGDEKVESLTTNVRGDKQNKTYNGHISKGQKIILGRYDTSGIGMSATVSKITVDTSWSNIIDPILPYISPTLLNKKVMVDGESTEIYKCPYTAKVERGQSYADVLLEYATIMCAHIYYDANGRLVIEPMIDTADDITDTNKEIVWHYTVEEKTFLGLTQTYNFDKIYNDIIVLGNIVNGYQFKARVQNRNLMSDTCVQKIGLKTKEPFEDNQYYSDEQCEELAIYYAKVDTILQKSGSISSVPLYHLDVNKLVSVSTPNNNMSKELFLITGFSLSSSDTMTINVISVNILKDFSVVGVDVYE